MRLLDRYLLRELLIPLVYCLSGFLIFWYTGDLINHMEDFRSQNLHALDIILYYFYRLPEFLILLLPMSLLLALLYALTTHVRHYEVIAMRAAGVSLGRLCVPYFAVGFLAGLGIFAANEFWLPASTDRAQQIMESGHWKNNVNFINSRDHRRWSIHQFDLVSGDIQGLDVEWRFKNGSRRLWVAERAYWTNQNWVLRDVQFYHFDSPESAATPVPTNQVVLKAFEETPDYIRSQIRLQELENVDVNKAIRVPLNLRDILEFERLQPDMDEHQRNLLTTKFHTLLATPWTCLLVVLIAVPIASRGGRRDAFVGVAGSIFLCFAYFVVQELSVPLGIGGHVPGAVAAWFPNAFFGALGAFMFFKAR